MRTSGATLSERLPAAIGGSRLTLGNIVRLGLFVVIASALLFSLAIWDQFGETKGLVCLTATCALLVTALPIALGRGKDLAEPIWFVVLIVAVGVTGKAFYLILGPARRVSFLLLGKSVEELLPATLLMALGLLCFSFGYLSGNLRWRLPLLDRLETGEPNVRRLYGVVGMLAVTGMFAFLAFASRFDISLDSLAAFSSKRLVLDRASQSFLVHGYLRWGSLLLETAFFLLFARWAATGRRLRSGMGLVIVLFGLGAAAFPFFVSSREGVMYLILRVGVVWLYLRGEPTLKRAFAVATVTLVLFGSMLAFRRDRSDWAGIRDHVGVSGLMESTIGGRHFLDLSKTAHVLDGVPELVDYQYGRTLVTWLVAPVPRAWWPGKPRIGAGGDLAVIFGTPWMSGVPPGIIAELYLNFGILGVLVGMIVAGFALRSLYATLQPRLPSPAVVLIFAFLSTRLALGMLSASVSGSAIRMFQEMIPLTLALVLCLGRPARGAAGSATTPPAGASERQPA